MLPAEPPPPPRPWAVLAALKEELHPLISALEDVRRVVAGGGSYLTGRLSGRPVVILQTGMGVAAARAGADWLFRTAKPRGALAIGFGGGLKEDLRPGDLVLASEVFEPPPPDGEGPRSWPAGADLLEGARSLSPSGQRVVEGRLVTVRKIISSAAEKRALGDRHTAAAVDMESSGTARAANVHDVPTVYLRVVIDDLSFDLPPELAGITTGEGRLRPFRALGAFLKNPGALGRLPELRRRALSGAAELARFARELLAAMPAEEETWG